MLASGGGDRCARERELQGGGTHLQFGVKGFELLQRERRFVAGKDGVELQACDHVAGEGGDMGGGGEGEERGRI